jgi:hypothetical protein
VTPHRIGLSSEGSDKVTPVELPGGGDQTSILVALTRMEAKVDVALAQHGARLDNVETDMTDHEARLRTLEAKQTVSPGKLWTAVSGASALLLAFLTFIRPLLGV